MKQLCDQFGGAVRQARANKGWSQEVLAEKAGLNRSFLGEIERGSSMPSLATIAKIARALNINMSTLLAHCESSA
jgi:transcriptional regulator with XRE-family HTH domain